MGIPFKIPRAQESLKAPAPRRPKLSSKKTKKSIYSKARPLDDLEYTAVSRKVYR